MRALPVLILAIVVAAPAAAQEAGELRPPLFTVAGLRDATKVGHRHRHRIEVPGKPTTLRTTEVLSVSEHGAVTRITTTDEAGKELEPVATKEITWAELERRSALPRAMALRERVVLETPAGSLTCTVAEVQAGAQVQRVAFSTDAPGIPVMIETFLGELGRPEKQMLLMRATLVELHPRPAAVAAPEGELLPPPFPADRIREATKVGRTYRFRVEQGGTTGESVMEFVAITAEGATLRRSMRDAAGQETKPPTDGPVTWKELESHAVFPRAKTTVSEVDVTVPAGTFRCKVYDVLEGTRAARFCFALDLPGAPIEMTISLRDPADPKKPTTVLQRMQLLEHVPGK